MNRTWVTRPGVNYRVEYWVEYRVIKYKSWVFTWVRQKKFVFMTSKSSYYSTLTHKWSKARIVWLDSTQLSKYSKYSCKKLVFDSRSSWILGHYWTYYLTPNIGQISNIFQIARLGRVICRSLLSTIAQLIIPPPPQPLPTWVLSLKELWLKL